MLEVNNLMSSKMSGQSTFRPVYKSLLQCRLLEGVQASSWSGALHNSPEHTVLVASPQNAFVKNGLQTHLGNLAWSFIMPQCVGVLWCCLATKDEQKSAHVVRHCTVTALVWRENGVGLRKSFMQ